MRLTDIAITNYRSIRRLSIPIHPLSVFVGENGVGKSNLYKSLSLLRDAATGQITRTIADEGGLNSVCWSGLRKRGEDANDLQDAIEDAFPGAELRAWEEGGLCQFDLQLADMPRPFRAHGRSDGTLKYICLLAVFMGYRLPPFIALN